jgi:hypothetical protein
MLSTDYTSVTDASISDPNVKLSRFNAINNQLLDQFCPLQDFKVKAKDVCPWMTSSLLALKNERDYYLSIFNNSPNKSKSDADWCAYQSIRARWQKANRIAYIEYYKSKGMSDFKNSKKFWDFYRASIRVKSDIPATSMPNRIFGDVGQLLTTPAEVANSFNGFFTSIKSSSTVCRDEAERQIYKTFKLLIEAKKLIINSRFSFKKVSVSEVEFHVNSMSSNSSPGYNGLHPKVLKSNPQLFPIITDIFNCCIESGIVPRDWKFAILTVLFKKGDRLDMNNYRGISVLPVLAKLFEKLLAEQITSYFIANNLFYSGQHGFRKGHSCETALHELLSELNVARDLKKIVLLLFIDFRKAFDTVDADLLIAKLLNYGFDDLSIKLIKSYFA